MSVDNNNVMVNPVGGDVGFRETPYRGGYAGASQPIMDASRSSGVTPQVLILLLMSAFKRCWKWALFLGLILSSIGAAVVWQFLPVKYEATSWIYAHSQVPYTVFQTAEGKGDYKNFLATQFAAIKSPLLLREVINDNRLAQVEELRKQKDMVRWLESNITVKQQQNSEYFTISCATSSPEDAYTIVNVVTDEYIKRNKTNVEMRENQLLSDLQAERNMFENSVKMQQKAIQQLMKDAVGKGAPANPALDINSGFIQQQSINKDFILSDAQLSAMTARYEAAKDFDPATREIPQILLDDAINNDPVVLAYQANINDTIAKVEARSKIVSSDDDRLRELKSSLEESQANLKELIDQLRSTKQKELQDRLKLTVQQDLWAKEAEIESQKVLVAKLREKVTQQNTDAQGQVDDSSTIAFLTTKLARDNMVLNKLSERIVTIQTENRSPARIMLYDQASKPKEPKTAMKLQITVVAGVGLFVMPFFLGIALEMMKPRLYHVSQVRKTVPEILIGEIMEPPVAWLHGNAFRKRLARYRESVHNWCTHLLLADPFRSCQTLAVASVAGDDGKTFLAIQIASAMAQMKSGPVLLIDGDMRVGRLHLLFGNEESGPGLADVLSFRKGIGEAVVLNEREPNLHLLSAGNLDVSPYELLGDGRFRELLDTLSTHYSMILVVLPPVTNAAESLMMASSVDSVILCVRQGETVLAAMEDAFRKLVTTGSHVDGVVVKDIPYSHMAGRDGGFSDKIEQIRLAHLLKHSESY